MKPALAWALQAGPVAIDTTSMVSVGFLIVIVTFAWKFGGVLSRIELKLDNYDKHQAKLEPIPGRVDTLEMRMDRVEEDVEELWGEKRGGESRKRP